LVILVGIFILMALAILKNGVDGAIKMWGIMGALTGVALGSITSYYFTREASKQEVAVISAEKEAIENRLAAITRNAGIVYGQLSPIFSAAAGNQGTAPTPGTFPSFLEKLPSDTISRFKLSHDLLENIEAQGEISDIENEEVASPQ